MDGSLPHPKGDRVLVRPIAEETGVGGLIVVRDEAPTRGEILAVGTGTRNDLGDFNGVDASPGEVVFYSKYGGQELEWDGEKLLLLRESDILATDPSKGGTHGRDGDGTAAGDAAVPEAGGPGAGAQ